jgi:[acyl-carrier-protein] S-malonyltransferase
MKIFACIFPGQGSQEVGMAGAFLTDPVLSGVFPDAQAALGFDLAGLIMNGPAETLTLTFNAQPAILATSYAAWLHLEKGIGLTANPLFMAGHSLGEFSALVASGALSGIDGLKLVRKRGELMQDAVPAGSGGMAALIGGTDDDAKKLAEACAEGEILDVANYNAPGQVVISGHAGAVQRAVDKSKDFGFKKAVLLNVSAPFHSRLMGPVREKFTDELGKHEFRTPRCPIVHNVTAQPNGDPALMPGLLAQQINSPVRWSESIELMIREGVEVFVEVGYGSVLQGLVKKIAGKDWPGKIVGCAKPSDVPNVLEALA